MISNYFNYMIKMNKKMLLGLGAEVDHDLKKNNNKNNNNKNQYK